MPLAARDRDEIVAYQPESGVRLELSQTDRQQGPWNRKEGVIEARQELKYWELRKGDINGLIELKYDRVRAHPLEHLARSPEDLGLKALNINLDEPHTVDALLVRNICKSMHRHPRDQLLWGAASTHK